MEQPRGNTIPDSLNGRGYATVMDVVARVCRDYADRPAFSSFGRTLSYGELDRLADAFAVYLQRNTDLEPGDRIAIQLPNIIQYPVALFGALRAGLVVVNTNPLYTEREMEHQFRDSGARALVIFTSMAHKAEKIIGNTPVKHVILTQIGDLHGCIKRTLLNGVVRYIKKMEPAYHLPEAVGLRQALQAGRGLKPRPVARATSDIAVLQYTGGTTGLSKGAVLTHGNLVANMLQGSDLISRAEKGWSETAVAPLPLYHIYAFTLSLILMENGGHTVLIPNPRDLKAFVRDLRRLRVSCFIGLNTLFVALCNREDFRRLDFSRLKTTISGGMALTHDAADCWREVTGCEIMEGYGLTETSPAVAINPPGAVRIGTIGQPLAETEVRIIDSDAADVPPGTPGELCIRGPQVMVGYWQREDETRAAFTDDGYFMTGDIAVQQEDGYLSIVDRAKDLIIVSGFNVYPNEVEDVVVSHPDVVECAAVGVPDDKSGEAIKLFVVSRNDRLDADMIRDWCKERLTRYKVPKLVEFTSELPKSNVGKVLRRKLRDEDHAA
ncbi:long-chain-fatty-acid--CoA ligase [Marinobacterium nitratireducens]|uniref:Long-chain-fatty-acid--CoA ligase n=1 Tax=Marinobacterium nitratireducens TaxID=518897 RepID=A0A917ZLT7_9GAMM|nr:AMP-binding protein [Marinobacterium nitratireducens]GGO86716.1 long-chain-fatty-acid--CoA ligase [Marinobacterium nitratireducens]